MQYRRRLHNVGNTYGDSNSKDKMTAFNGVTITYGAIGNPLTNGSWTYAWQHGRQLQRMGQSGTTASFGLHALSFALLRAITPGPFPCGQRWFRASIPEDEIL